ncbi:glycosyltransferase [Aliikangiella sp. G2MR2-5]|uniref:glycosyltransferase n=1 Tax=Aliikangiella sp. G2MR2-5 TaxID=2788943 RepID=UPI0018A93F4F|nr:glycosyltransferase [Aliikangiella sp. G2MR2-5]
MEKKNNNYSKVMFLFPKTKTITMIKQIIASNEFDHRFYNNEYGYNLSEKKAVEHYILFGASRGLNPNNNFSTKDYIKMYKDVEESDINPFYHFLKYGKSEGRFATQRLKQLKTEEQIIVDTICQSALFDLEFYQKQVGQQFDDKINAALHYLREGAKEGYDTHLLFSTSYYYKKNLDVSAKKLNALHHFLVFGSRELRTCCELFKPEYFLSQLTGDELDLAKVSPLEYFLKNPKSAKPFALYDHKYYEVQVGRKVSNALVNYLKGGYKQGFSLHPLFDNDYYLENNSLMDEVPLISYLKSNDKYIRVHPLFDPTYYVARHKGVRDLSYDLLSHYIACGSKLNFWPNPVFWPQHYTSQVKLEELECFDSHLTHYVLKGDKVGVEPNPWFNPVFYRDMYSFISKLGITSLEHYLQDGWKDHFLPSDKFFPKYVKSRYQIPNDVEPLHFYMENIMGDVTCPPYAWRDDGPEYIQWETVKAHFSIAEEKQRTPKVSIIIPVYNNFSYTLRCLYSIAISVDATDYEVIIADDKSTDETFSKLSQLSNVKYILNEENLGFLLSCNNAAKAAKGEFLFFLNNDTAVIDGWLDNSVKVFEENEQVGLVGSKLLFPNGILQEAGGLLWHDGAANYGKWDDPNRPEYSYLRKSDYISGAAILLKTALWETVGGFDNRYAPAYCEDSDLCLTIRNMGLKVLLQPESKVVHFEGVSSGTDLSTGIKKYQVINSQKLNEKWIRLLKSNGSSKDFSVNDVGRSNAPKLLIVDAIFPTPDQDAGSLTVWYYLKIFRNLGMDITFIPTNLNYSPGYVEQLQAIGVRCLYRPYVSNLEEYFLNVKENFDIVMLYRVWEGGRLIELVKKKLPRAKIIFDTVDLHFVREEREAMLETKEDVSRAKLVKAAQTKSRELYLLEAADTSIVVSYYEEKFLKKSFNIKNTTVLPIILDVPGCKRGFDDRKDIAFIGGYQHTPNVDAVLYFFENIWAEVKRSIPGIKFYVIGSKPTKELLRLSEKDEDIIVTGFVEELDPYLDRLRLTIAPLRFGAGIKGKVGSSLSYGVPCITSKVASEGMGLKNGRDILMSSTDEEFVQNLLSAYSDKVLWEKLSTNGIQFVKENYSVEVMTTKLSNLLYKINAKPFSSVNPFSGQEEVFRLTEEGPTNNWLCSLNSLLTDRMVAKKLISFANIITHSNSESFDSATKKLESHSIQFDFINSKTNILSRELFLNFNLRLGGGSSIIDKTIAIGAFEAKDIEELKKLIVKGNNYYRIYLAIDGTKISKMNFEKLFLSLHKYFDGLNLDYSIEQDDSLAFLGKMHCLVTIRNQKK